MDLLAAAQTLLGAAQGALPAVERAFLGGGPGIALTCTQLVVYPGPISVTRFGDGCAMLEVPQLVLVYAKDCYPTIDQKPGEARVPPAAELTAWTSGWLADLAALYAGVLDAVEAGSFGGGCTSVTVRPSNFAGPLTGVCSVRIPIDVSPT